MGLLRLFTGSFLVLLLALLLFPFQFLGLIFFPSLARRLPIFFHKVAMMVLGIRLHVEGEFVSDRPLLLASNHCSWLDIILIASVIPASFIAKSNLRMWPIVGQMAWLQRTIFIDRHARLAAGKQSDKIAKRLGKGKNEVLVLFPEGTTSDGISIFPFKSSLFESIPAALSKGDLMNIMVQPMAIMYTRIHGLPIGHQWRHKVVWAGDRTLLEGILTLFRSGALDVTIRLGAPIICDSDMNRKEIAKRSYDAVRSLLQRSMEA